MTILTAIDRNLAKADSLFEAEQVILNGVLRLGQVMMQNFDAKLYGGIGSKLEVLDTG